MLTDTDCKRITLSILKKSNDPYWYLRNIGWDGNVLKKWQYEKKHIEIDISNDRLLKIAFIPSIKYDKTKDHIDITINMMSAYMYSDCVANEADLSKLPELVSEFSHNNIKII